MNFIQFTEKLKKYDSSKIVFIGLGSETRKDDFAGVLFIRNLRKSKRFKKSIFIEAGRNPENYLEKILRSNPQAVVFADAAKWGGKPGEIRWLDPDKINSISISTHTFSIKMIEQYLTSHYPIEFFYIGIQPDTTEIGEDTSNYIKEALNKFFSNEAVHP
jgi:hydrogenase 3 maturation protease